jgi:DNA-binding GntR family transcriptional regulator
MQFWQLPHSMAFWECEGRDMEGGGAYQTVKRADTAAAALRRAIHDRALKPGTRLPAKSIALGFGMSRTLAREVLLRLEGAGLVELRPKRGAIVACPSINEAQDIFEVRRCLEARSLARLSETWTDKLERELENHVLKEEAAAIKGDLNASIKLAENFHLKLAAMSGNKALAQYIDEIVSRCSLILALYGRPHATDCAVSEHRMILDALKRGGADEASRAMDQHLIALQECAIADDTASGDLSLQQVIHRYADQGSGSESVKTNDAKAAPDDGTTMRSRRIRN